MASGEGSDPGAFLAGKQVAVDPGKIERELALLWKPTGAADTTPSVTRAAVSNLVIPLEEGEAPDRARQMVRDRSPRSPIEGQSVQKDDRRSGAGDVVRQSGPLVGRRSHGPSRGQRFNTLY